ncbi:MAG: hypothetical protein WC777_05385 [Candidatus Gracilibacteria bacterium]
MLKTLPLLLTFTACQPQVLDLVEEADQLPGVEVASKEVIPHRLEPVGTEVVARLTNVREETRQSLNGFSEETERTTACTVELMLEDPKPKFAVTCWE